MGGTISHLRQLTIVFAGFPRLARSLIRKVHGPAEDEGAEKGEYQMSAPSPFARTVIAFAAALVMSTVTVGAAVGPAQAVASPAPVAVNG